MSGVDSHRPTPSRCASGEQGRRQRGPHADQPLAAGQHSGDPDGDRRGPQGTAGARPGALQQPEVVGLDRTRHAVAAPRGGPPVAEPAGIERLDLDRTTDLASGTLRVVVGIVGGPHEPDAEMFQHPHEPVDAVDERRPTLGGCCRPGVVADRLLQVGEGLVAGVGCFFAAHERVVGQPQPAARHGGAASPPVGALDHHDPQTPVGSRDRRREGGRSRPDHDDVVAVIERCVHDPSHGRKIFGPDSPVRSILAGHMVTHRSPRGAAAPSSPPGGSAATAA